MFADGRPVPASMRLMVASPTVDNFANSTTEILNKALAALICSLVINLISLYNDPISITKRIFMMNNDTSKQILAATIEKIEGA